MKILIDARLYGLHHRGIGRYLMELINGIIACDQLNQYVLLVNPRSQGVAWPTLPANFTLQAAPYPTYSLAEQLFLPGLIKKHQPDLIHWPHFNAPFFSPQPFVITIHDLILHQAPTERASTLPGLVYWFKIFIYYQLIRHLLKRAKRIITVSRAVALELINFYPWARAKVTTIHLAAPNLPLGKINPALRPYVLVVGAAYPHKNLERVIEANAVARQEQPELELYIVGRSDHFMNRLKESIEPKGYLTWVKFKGEVVDDELATLYRNCQAYLLLSLQEGFGLGPLEAAQQGAFIIASDIPVLRGVLERGAIFVEPHDVGAITAAIISSQQPNLRAKITAEAPAMLEKYSWSECVKKTLKLYQEVIVK